MYFVYVSVHVLKKNTVNAILFNPIFKYSLGVKRDEMRKLEEIAGAEEKRIEMAEKFLEEDAALFDEFLKENGNNSTQAVKM